MANLPYVKILATVLVTGLLAVSAPAAARPTGEILLRGDRSASVEIRLERTVRLECCRFVEQTVDGQTSFRISGFDVSTEGTYAGFAIERARDGRIMKGAVRIPPMDLEEGRMPTFVSFGRASRLPAGKYRLHLLADGPSTVRVTAAGLGRTLDLVPSGRSHVSAELTALATTGGPQQAQARVPVEVGKGATVLLASKTEGEYAQAHYLGQCLVEPGGQCSQDDYETWASPASGGGGGTTVDSFVGTVEPGTYEAVFVAGSLGAPQGSYGFVLVLG